MVKMISCFVHVLVILIVALPSETVEKDVGNTLYKQFLHDYNSTECNDTILNKIVNNFFTKTDRIILIEDHTSNLK